VAKTTKTIEVTTREVDMSEKDCIGGDGEAMMEGFKDLIEHQGIQKTILEFMTYTCKPDIVSNIVSIQHPHPTLSNLEPQYIFHNAKHC
jgi:hypothetical protein